MMNELIQAAEELCRYLESQAYRRRKCFGSLSPTYRMYAEPERLCVQLRTALDNVNKEAPCSVK